MTGCMQWIKHLVLVWLLAVPALSSGQSRDPAAYFFHDTFGDFHEELAQAREDGKSGILIFFEQDDCPFCYRMLTTVLNQPEVQDFYRAHFNIFRVDTGGDLEISDFGGHKTTQKDFAFRQYQVRATPVFAFFDLEGKLVARHTGPTADVQEFLWLGEYVAGEHYRTDNFTHYKRERRAQAADG